jgi:hypothetical protein
MYRELYESSHIHGSLFNTSGVASEVSILPQL